MKTDSARAKPRKLCATSTRIRLLSAIFELLPKVIDDLRDDEREDVHARHDEDRHGQIFPELKRPQLWLGAQSRFRTAY
jgi:hypothetical protein